jgi:hypothetical protein
MARKPAEFERLNMRERFRGTKARDLGDVRLSAYIQEHALAPESAYATVLQLHLNGLRSNKAAFAKDQFGAACFVFVHMHADEAINHPPLPGPHFSHFDSRRRGAAAEFAVMPDEVGHFRAVDHVFGRQEGAVRA